MRRVMSGKVFDTETATKIGQDQEGGSGDLSAWSEALYVTAKGVYFTAGTGGPMSHYAQSVGQNQWSGGSAIRVLPREDALAWCERAELPLEIIAAHFELEAA